VRGWVEGGGWWFIFFVVVVVVVVVGEEERKGVRDEQFNTSVDEALITHTKNQD
jgi:hypothetical protein